MSEQEDQNKLTKSQEFDNLLSAMAWPFIWLATVQWTLTTWYAQWKNCKRKGKPFRPQAPRKITVLITNGVPAAMSILLSQWGISNQECGLSWVDRYTLERSVLVSAQQFDYADAILHQEGYTITTPSGSKRGVKFAQPWGVGAKARSFDEGLTNMIGGVLGAKHHGVSAGHKSAKLGKTYS